MRICREFLFEFSQDKQEKQWLDKSIFIIRIEKNVPFSKASKML